MAKSLKIWNGRGFNRTDPQQPASIYVAAYSVADARRVCIEVGYGDPGVSEIQNYWSRGCWGRDMDGIKVERGVWFQVDGEKPKRLVPCGAKVTC